MIAVYARVSTEEQARNGYSLQDQIRECRKRAGSELVEEYIDEGVSGEVLDRPQLSRLRMDVSQGRISKVLCLDPDRLSRKLMNQLILSEEIEKKAELIFVNGEYNQTPEGRLFYQLRGAISEFEKAKINERMSRGRREKARQGRVVRDYSIYGYNYNPKAQQLSIHPFEAEIVKTIFHCFTCQNEEASGINGIARYLTEQGIPTKRGAKEWHRQVVRQILMNRAYIGQFYQNRWNCEGMLGNKFKAPDDQIPLRQRPSEEWILVSCPPIIDKEVFFYAQQLLDESRRRWAGKSRNSYLLSGLVRCGLCGNTMTGRKSKNWGSPILEYCDIKGTAGTKNRGCGTRMKADVLEDLVWDQVLKQLKTCDTALFSKLPSPTLRKSKLQGMELQLAEIRKNRSKLLRLLTVLGEDIGKSGLEDVRRELRALKTEEELLCKQLEDPASQQPPGEELLIPVNPFHAAWDYYILKGMGTLAFEDKQALIRHWVREITVFTDEIQIQGF